MAISNKPEFPPLLPPGLRVMAFSDLKKLTMDAFPLSTKRGVIFAGVEEILSTLSRLAIPAEVWIDGSFLTQKIEPGDCDLVVRVDAEFADGCSDEQFQVLTWIKSNLKTTLLCDSYIFAEWPEGHEGREAGLEIRDYWLRWFGNDRRGNAKGIAVVRTPL